MCERVLHLLWRCLGDRMQISLFMWGYFKFNHRWGLGWKIFFLLLVFSPSSNNLLLPASESFSSSSFWVSRYQRWQGFLQANKKKAKVRVHFAFSSSRLKKNHVHWATSYSIFLEAWWIHKALNHSLKSRLKLGGARISVKCSSVGKGRVRRTVKLDRGEKD